MEGLSFEELLAWNEQTATGWRALLTAYPQALALPCDTREGQTLGDLMHHIVAVELRYAERLSGLAESSYAEIPRGTAEALYETHDRAMSLVRDLIARPRQDWEETLEFSTRSAGVLRATRRTILVHLLLHGIRHYAQAATVVRHGGIPAGWGMDYLFMGLR